MKNGRKKLGAKEIAILVVSVAAIIGMVALLIFGGSESCFEVKEPDVDTYATDMPMDEPMSEPVENIKVYDVIPEGHPQVTITMEDDRQIVMELYPEYAPQTVANFVELAESGFYDGVGFHRVVEGFMAQGGDPEGTGMGGSAFNIKGEFSSNGFEQNTLKHERGVVSMARSNAPDSASSQFFICYDAADFLDGEYAAFGKVVEGMDVVDSFLDVERTANEMGEEATPVTPIIMKSVTVSK